MGVLARCLEVGIDYSLEGLGVDTALHTLEDVLASVRSTRVVDDLSLGTQLVLPLGAAHENALHLI